MKSWEEKIPPEILELILTYISDSKDLDRLQNLFSCELVCRSWRATAKRVAYANIVLNTYQAYERLVAPSSMQLDQTVESIGELVKTLYLDLWLSPEYCTTYLPKFIKLFPSLEHLKARIPSDSFYQVLVNCNSTWKHLKSIPEPFFESSIVNYSHLACKYQETLTSLLCNDSHLLFPPAGQDSRLFVRRFPKLTHLKLKRLSNHPLEAFDSILEGLHLLQSLDFNIRPQRMVIVAGELNSMQDDSLVIMDSIVAHPAIKRVRGLVVIYNDRTLLYLIQKYPQLHYLDINYRDAIDRKFKVIDNNGRCTFSPVVVAQFIVFVQKIRRHSIQFQLPANTLHQAFEQYEATSDAPHALTISYKAGNHLHYYIPEVEDEPNAVIQISNIASGGNERSTSRIQVFYNSSDALTVQPHLILIEKLGAHLDRLSISISSEYLPGRPNISVLALCLDEVFKHCNHLRHLTIYESTFVFSVIHNSYITNSSITDLVLTDITILNQDVLSHVSKSLPSLHNLVVDNCKFESYAWDGSLAYEKNHGQIGMKCTSFDTISIKNTFRYTIGNPLCVEITSSSDDAVSRFQQFVYDQKNRLKTSQDMDYADDYINKICITCASIKTLKFNIGPFHDMLDLTTSS